MMTKDRPKTYEEVLALPVYQPFLTETYNVKDLRISNGKAWIRGQLIPINPQCKSISINIVNEPLEVTYHDPDDIIGCSDEDGFSWRVVKNREGYWFRILQP